MKHTERGSRFRDSAAILERVVQREDVADAPTENWSGIRQRHGLAFLTTEAKEEEQTRREKKPVVLVPVDFSPTSLAAASCGIQLAEACQGLLLLVHAVYLNLAPYGPANPEWLKKALCEEALAKAEPILMEAQSRGVTALCAVEEGTPASVMARAARRWEARMVVLARGRRGLLARLFGRRNVEKMVRRVECPVLVLQTDFKEGIL